MTAPGQLPPEPPPGVRREMHRSHLRMAERMVDHHSDHLRYAHGLGWHAWDGQRWIPDATGYATRAAIQTVKRSYADLGYLPEDDRKKLWADLRAAESSSGIGGMLRLASCLQPIAVAPSDLDPDPFLFNTANGTLDLHTGELRPHNPADLITKVAGCGYDETATCPIFDTFLAEILPDEDVRMFVQRVFGYAMLGVVRDHVLPVFTGTGGNGKGTLVELMLKVFGGYGMESDPDLLVQQPRGTHPTGQADLFGARLVITDETDEDRRMATATMKRLTGGNTVKARRMRQDFFEFRPSHTIILVTNHPPVVSGSDDAVWRRLRVVPFGVKIPDNQVDTTLYERLEQEMAGVLLWAVAGYRAYLDRGLDLPDAVIASTAAYKDRSDAPGRFLAERTRPSPAGHIRARELYQAWTKWCQDAGETPGTETAFAETMLRRGYTRKKTKAANVYQGLYMLTDNDDPDQPPEWYP